MQRKAKPLSLVTGMHPAREHDVTFLQMIPPTPDGTPPGFSRLKGDVGPGRANIPKRCRPGTFRKSIPPGSAGGLRIPNCPWT
jgi:hypothetical protein